MASNPTEVSTGQARPNVGRQGSGGVFLPSLQETLHFDNLAANWKQTDDYINKFNTEKEELSQTYEKCQEILANEFKKLRQLLTDREEILEKQLEMRFRERDDSLENQINLLEDHKSLNEETEDKCKNLIATMQDRKEREKRTEMITNLCNECIIKSPILKAVPIDLEHKFVKHKTTVDIIGDYGKLVFKGIERGKPRKFINKEHEVTHTEYHVGDTINKNKNKYKDNRISSSSSSSRFIKDDEKQYNNNNNNNNDNHKMEEKEKEDIITEETEPGAEEGRGSGGGGGQEKNDEPLPGKVKLSVLVSKGDQVEKKRKLVIMTYKPDKIPPKNDYKLDFIKTKIKTVKLIKELKRDDIEYEFILPDSNNQEISNDNDLINYVVRKIKDEKTIVNINAEVIN